MNWQFSHHDHYTYSTVLDYFLGRNGCNQPLSNPQDKNMIYRIKNSIGKEI